MKKYYFAIIVLLLILIVAIGAQIRGHAYSPCDGSECAEIEVGQEQLECRMPSQKYELAKSNESVRVPIVMYHNISPRISRHGKFVISPQELSSDLERIKNEGFESIHFKDLIDYVHYGRKLPQKPVILTFDDGDIGVYKYAFPALKERGMRAVVSVIGEVTDKFSNDMSNESFPNLRWCELRAMQQSGVFEIQNHTYNLHKNVRGCAKRLNESQKQYAARLEEDLLKMQQRLEQELGSGANTFVYPYGKISKESREVVKRHFSCSLSCYEGENEITVGNADCLWELKRYNRPHGGKLPKKVLIGCALNGFL